MMQLIAGIFFWGGLMLIGIVTHWSVGVALFLVLIGMKMQENIKDGDI